MTKTETRSEVRGRPAQYKQASRKGKQAWRKNIDLSATEAALEDIREQERTAGAPAHTQANNALFVEDRSGQETQLARQAREKRKLKSQEILEARSAVPAIQQRSRSAFQLDTHSPAGKANAAGLPAKVKRRLRILASRPHEGMEGEAEMGSAGKVQSDAAVAEKHDLWGAPPAKPVNEWVTSTMPQAVHRPRSMAHEPNAAAKSTPAIGKPHAGSSYNPDFHAHEELLQEAIQKAAAEEEDIQETQRLREQWRNAAQDASGNGFYMGMHVDDGSDATAEQEEDNEEADDGHLPTKLPGRKTAAQRRREARAKEQFLQAEQRRRQRQQRALAAELPGHMKKIRHQAQTRQALVDERRARKLERMQKQGMAGFRIGKHAVPEQRLDVQTGDELSESFRQLKPEGNLFWDRFQNLQARGLAEARRPVAPTQKLKRKTYDRHSFKRDD